MHSTRTYSSATAATLAGVTHRQLDYWTRTNRLHPLNALPGSGMRRRFRRRDVIVAEALSHLFAAGAHADVTMPASVELYALDVEPRGTIIVTSTGEVIPAWSLLDVEAVDAFGWLVTLSVVERLDAYDRGDDLPPLPARGELGSYAEPVRRG